MDVCFNNFRDFHLAGNENIYFRLKLCNADNSKIFDKDYFDSSSKHLEIYKEKYLDVADTFKREYENMFNEELYLDKKF
jgi:hypothetical protein